MSRTKTHAEVSFERFADAPDEPTIRYEIPTSPGFATSATISRQTARELVRELQRVLDEIDAANR